MARMGERWNSPPLPCFLSPYISTSNQPNIKSEGGETREEEPCQIIAKSTLSGQSQITLDNDQEN